MPFVCSEIMPDLSMSLRYCFNEVELRLTWYIKCDRVEGCCVTAIIADIISNLSRLRERLVFSFTNDSLNIFGGLFYSMDCVIFYIILVTLKYYE